MWDQHMVEHTWTHSSSSSSTCHTGKSDSKNVFIWQLLGNKQSVHGTLNSLKWIFHISFHKLSSKQVCLTAQFVRDLSVVSKFLQNEMSSILWSFRWQVVTRGWWVQRAGRQGEVLGNFSSWLGATAQKIWANSGSQLLNSVCFSWGVPPGLLYISELHTDGSVSRFLIHILF